jgi:glycosyltransferase involved in cell wall biosynthesis
MPHYDVPYLYGRPFVATVHDIIHYLYPQFSTKPLSRFYSKTALQHVAKRARRIITVSDNTKKDLETHFPRSQGKIRVIYPAVNQLFKPVSPDRVRLVLNKYNLRPGYFLYVGNLRASKNTSALISAYATLKKRHPDAPPLILVGKMFIKNLGAVPNDVFHIESASNDELPAFYSGATLFVYPSLYEGFGLPPLEAMACGAAVISSRAASLPEVCGNAAHYIDPQSESELVDAMWELITSSSRRDEMKKKGLENVKRFSWKRFAASTWQVYNESLA